MPDTLLAQSLQTFLDTLASDAPTPGGGSVTALSGATAAGLISMVCAITLNKANGDDASDIRTIHTRAEELRRELQQLAEDDIEVFGRLSVAYKLPRTTAADAASRRAAIQNITRQAAEVPLRTARAAVYLLPLCTAMVNRCSRLLVSDIGVAATLIHATIQSALLSVEINLTALEDQNYVRQVRAQIEDLTVGTVEEIRGILDIVQSRMRS
ncbi:MAG: cyclodeaminase/cyclohydrolase family protein [Chloroflexaceae bacterium]|nr:cyclodeaminase/cyclohydrolase family protein [Chloroflexaceae bacterium]NJO07134.1 cyclodeaminase/cyclohydrolase family protein [Chloroflexaceae bacterium]